MIVMLGMAMIAFTPIFTEFDDGSALSTLQLVTFIIVSIVFGFPVISGVVLLIYSLVAFRANVIQFGIDQLRDAPTEDSILYIYWYVWTVYFALLLTRIPFAVVQNKVLALLVNGILSEPTKYTYMYDDNFTNTTYDASENYILYSSGCIIPLIVVIIIPAYLFLLRLIFYNYIPWLLTKRMGVGIAVLLISGICTLLMGVVNHDCISDEEIC